MLFDENVIFGENMFFAEIVFGWIIFYGEKHVFLVKTCFLFFWFLWKHVFLCVKFSFLLVKTWFFVKDVFSENKWINNVIIEVKGFPLASEW